MVAGVACLIMSTIVINISRKEHEHAVPHVLFTVLNSRFTRKVLLLPQSTVSMLKTECLLLPKNAENNTEQNKILRCFAKRRDYYFTKCTILVIHELHQHTIVKSNKSFTNKLPSMATTACQKKRRNLRVVETLNVTR